MFDDAQLQALAAVLRHGSFDRAAAVLHVTPSAVSQRIRALEEQAGATLVHRGPPARGTATGLRLARHADDRAILEAALAADLGRAPPTATLRIAVNADSLATWVLPALAAVPGALYDLVIDDQDHSADLLRRGEVQAAITGQPGPLRGCDTHPLGALRYVATAAPEFRDRHFAGGLTAEAFARAPALSFNAKDRLQADWAAGILGRPVVLPVHRIGSSHAFVDAARLGLGWGMNPEPLARAALAAGTLVALDPDRPMDVALYWQTARLTAPALAPLTRALRAAARAALIGEAPPRPIPAPQGPRPGTPHRRS